MHMTDRSSTLSPRSPLLATPAGALSAARVAMIGRDEDLMEMIGGDLMSLGYALLPFDGATAALDFLSGGGKLDVILVHWDSAGLEALRKARATGVETPMVVVAREPDAVAEELALEHGALDYIDLSRRTSIIVKRLSIVIDGVKTALTTALPTDADAASPATPPADTGLEEAPDRLIVGDLRLDNARAYWQDARVDLTLTEFKMVHMLASRPDEDLSYRELYDIVHGAGFMAGYGNNGYRANVRAFIKRIRAKFRTADETFDRIGNYPGFGYRWLTAAAALSEVAEATE